MKVGDLLRYKDQHWIVRLCDPRRTHKATLLAASGQTEDVAFDADTTGEAVVLGNPAASWPFVSLRIHPKFGKLGRIVRHVGPVGAPVEEDLVLYVDWVPSDPVRNGGPVFLSPALGFKGGMTLVAIYERGRARILIPVNFNTVNRRIALATPAPRIARTAYNQLLDEDDL